MSHLAFWLHSIWHPLQGSGYQFWSGFGSDIGEVAIVGAALGLFRRHNCHVKRCPRIGKFHVDGTPYVVCGKHHPTVPNRITAGHVEDAAAG